VSSINDLTSIIQ